MKAVKTGRRVYGNLSPRSPCAGKKSSNPVNLHFQPKSLGHVKFLMVFTARIPETELYSDEQLILNGAP